MTVFGVPLVKYGKILLNENGKFYREGSRRNYKSWKVTSCLWNLK